LTQIGEIDTLSPFEAIFFQDVWSSPDDERGIMALLTPQAVCLIFLAALGYGLATIGLKIGAASPGLSAIAMILIGFSAAALAEMEILKEFELGVVYIMMIGLETLMVLGYAFFIGEGLSLRQVGGASMVLFGLAVVSN